MQQVNLYLPEFRPKRDYLSAEISAVALCSIFIGLMALYVIKSIDQSKLEQKVVVWEEDKKSLEAEIKAIESRPKPINSTELEKDIVQAKAALKNRENIAKVISGQELGNQKGFYTGIKALGTQLEPNISLTYFKFSKGGKILKMSGYANEAYRVPLYVQKLHADPFFKNTTFGFLALHRENQGIKFDLTGDGAVPEELLADDPNLVLYR